MKSILSFPERGPYGKSSYRGNCSGFLIKSLLDFFKPKLFVDPCIGGGTSKDVVKTHFPDMEFFGFDLHSGFNLLRDNLLAMLPREANYVFFHPPYHNLHGYSGSVWGNAPHPDDLSHCRSHEDFLEKMYVAMCNIFEATCGGGHYSILIGDIRERGGEYWTIQADLLKIAPGRCTGVLIKEQHNCQSDRTIRSDKFFRISHEYVLNFQKPHALFGIVDCALQTRDDLNALNRATWKGVVGYALRMLGGRAHLKDIYAEVKRRASEKVRQNGNFDAKVRQVLQKYFTHAGRGEWMLNEA